MSDRDLERFLTNALHAPVTTRADASARIMTEVRRAAEEGDEPAVLRVDARSSNAPLPLVVRFGRRTRHAIVGAALAAGLGSLTTMTSVHADGSMPSRAHVTAAIIGDTIVGRLGDTLRLVRLVFDDAGARRVAVVGDFNEWHPDATPMHRESAGSAWSATLALRDGEHRYAIVVDDTRLAPLAAERRAAAPSRLVAILRVGHLLD